MILTFPHMGSLGMILEDLFRGLGMEVVPPPPISKDTIAHGTTLAPEGSCLPFKIILGNFMEAVDSGADTIVMLGGTGPCRFGYFSYLIEMILRDHGYRFKMIILDPEQLFPGVRDLFGGFGRSLHSTLKQVYLAWTKLKALDSLHQNYLSVQPYLAFTSGTFYQESVTSIINSRSPVETASCLKTGLDVLNRCRPTPDSRRPRVGLIGDIYTLLEPMANYQIETELGRLGLELEKSIYLSSWLVNNISPIGRRRHGYFLRCEAGPYLEEAVGGHGLDTVAWAVRFARKGMAGVIHVLPLTCMPEIVAESILPRISRDYNVPVISLSVDEHFSPSGFRLRLEAFADMVN